MIAEKVACFSTYSFLPKNYLKKNIISRSRNFLKLVNLAKKLVDFLDFLLEKWSRFWMLVDFSWFIFYFKRDFVHFFLKQFNFSQMFYCLLAGLAEKFSYILAIDYFSKYFWFVGDKFQRQKPSILRTQFLMKKVVGVGGWFGKNRNTILKINRILFLILTQKCFFFIF